LFCSVVAHTLFNAEGQTRCFERRYDFVRGALSESDDKTKALVGEISVREVIGILALCEPCGVSKRFLFFCPEGFFFAQWGFLKDGITALIVGTTSLHLKGRW
jgi:hypothetical protein